MPSPTPGTSPRADMPGGGQQDSQSPGSGPPRGTAVTLKPRRPISGVSGALSVLRLGLGKVEARGDSDRGWGGLGAASRAD